MAKANRQWVRGINTFPMDRIGNGLSAAEGLVTRLIVNISTKGCYVLREDERSLSNQEVLADAFKERTLK